MAESQGQEKTEKPTPFKLKEAKNRGQVSKSTEVNSLILLGAVLFLSYVISHSLMSNYIGFSRALMAYDAAALATPEGVFVLFGRIFDSMLGLFWPLVAVVVLAGILSNLVQTGPVFSFFPLKPDPQRLNPVSGFKRIFSKRMLYETVKTMIKLTLFAVVGYICIVGFLPVLMTYMDIAPEAYGVRLLSSGQELVVKLLLVVMLVALIDFMYTRWDFTNQMRMSHKEVKDEVKRRDGDPLVRAKRRELQKEALERSKSLSSVPDADVLITNPTHIAVALKFDRNTMVAPTTIAKGSGDMAQKMKQVARKSRVPIVENKPLARAIFRKVSLNKAVTEDMYPLVAKIYAWLAAR